MLTAKRAKEIADKFKKLKPCLDRIEKAANSGLHTIVFQKRLDKETRDQLRELGFKVGSIQEYKPEPLGPDIPYDVDEVSWE